VIGFSSTSRGARYLTGENLIVVWAEFLTLKLGRIAIVYSECMAYIQPLLELIIRPMFSPVSLSLPMDILPYYVTFYR
jgi:hypothetical protein